MPNSDLLARDEVITTVSECVPMMVEHARDIPGEEVVGAVMADGFTVRLGNEAEDKTSHMKVSPSQLEYLDSIVAIYHSHPQGSELPSIADEQGHSPIPIVIVTPETVILWWYSDNIPGYYRIWDRHYGIE